MENPTASETTHATRPAPYPITVASSTSEACAAIGAIAVAKAAIAAAFGSTFASAFGITAGALNAGLVDGFGVENAEAHATIIAKMNATEVFMVALNNKIKVN